MRAANEDRLHHAYLFEGPEGVGKATFALWLARYVNCEAEVRPCGTCRSCRLMISGAHPDLVVVGPDPEKATRIISVDQAQALTRALQLQRHSARRRFVLLDPADVINEEAANSLLKTIEEPPRGTQFVLITSRVGSLLQTIRSRTERVRFGPVPTEDFALWLSGRGISEVHGLAASGSPGIALRLHDGEGDERLAARDAMLDAIGQPLFRLFAYSEAEGKKDEGVSRAELVVNLLEELLRDCVCLANGRGDRLLHADRRDRLEPWARALWPGGLARMTQALATARDRLRLNVNGRTVLESLFAQLNLELTARPAENR
ncbi:DNA polymerase III subunit delta' [Deltaproteobacteria bacterium]|nr:DNA polymerase III subunit delta' [Deltaproteobacteria bacterium]